MRKQLGEVEGRLKVRGGYGKQKLQNTDIHATLISDPGCI